MKRIYGALCILLLSMLLILSGCHAPAATTASPVSAGGYDVTDVQGTVVHFNSKPQRILTLSMETEEMMLGLVSPSNMVAVNALLDDPLNSTVVPQAQQIPVKITDPSVEAIAAMKPDVVIIPDWGSLEKVVPLRDLGIPVVVCKGAVTMAEVKDTIRLLSRVIGEEERGSEIIRQMDVQLADIKRQVDAIPQEKRKSVVLISLMNTYGGIGCLFDDACRYAGVTNGMATAGIRNGQAMSKEMLVKINPDYLFLPSYTNHGNYDSDRFVQQYLEDPALQTLTAVRENHLVKPRESYLYNGSQDVVFGIREIAFSVYGQTFAQPAGKHISAVP